MADQKGGVQRLPTGKGMRQPTGYGVNKKIVNHIGWSGKCIGSWMANEC